jgi:hypothetical protein
MYTERVKNSGAGMLAEARFTYAGRKYFEEERR